MNKADLLFNKLAGSFESAMSGKKLFNMVSSSEDILKAIRQQPFIKKLVAIVGKKNPEFEQTLLKEFRNVGMHNRAIAVPFRNNKGKNSIAINKNVFKGLLKPERREILAHEAFHAKAPMGLGHSEILAHLYGGLKSGTLPMATKRLLVTRPIRTALEIAPVVAGGTIINKLRKEENG